MATVLPPIPDPIEVPTRTDHRVSDAEQARLRDYAFLIWVVGCTICGGTTIFFFHLFANASICIVMGEIACIAFVYFSWEKFRLAVPEYSSGTGFDPWHKTFPWFSWCDPDDPYVGIMEFPQGNHWRPWQLERFRWTDMVPYKVDVEETIPVKGGSDFTFRGYCELSPWPGMMPVYNAVNDGVIDQAVKALYIGLMLAFTKKFNPLELVSRIAESDAAVTAGFNATRQSDGLSIERKYAIVVRTVAITRAMIDKRLKDAVAGELESKSIARSAKAYANVDPDAVRLALATANQIVMTRHENATTFELKGDGLDKLKEFAPSLAALAPTLGPALAAAMTRNPSKNHSGGKPRTPRKRKGAPS